ncbi:hypothetical protein PR048_019275 [Dryococelus australis]|uniref:Uncharacterized protein n=1 Tax=Dryococelus australis TaxID=614101 RepID=A0ABQ9H329_9NEOP|nr:hypothetical protein PR048_019275 [Dryococelus australis]
MRVRRARRPTASSGTSPTCGGTAGDRTRFALVGGERANRSATVAPMHSHHQLTQPLTRHKPQDGAFVWLRCPPASSLRFSQSDPCVVRPMCYPHLYFMSRTVPELYYRSFHRPINEWRILKVSSTMQSFSAASKRATSIELQRFLIELSVVVRISWSENAKWPARSPDLTPMDLYLRRTLKQRVYKDPPTTPGEMKGRITRACSAISPAEIRYAVLSAQNRFTTEEYTTSIEVDIKTPVYPEIFSVFEAERRESVKGDTATRIKSLIAAKRKALNLHAVFSSCCVYLWDFQRRPYYFIGG